jgi:uncharacterized protein YukE
MKIPRIIGLLGGALVVTGCATGYAEHQAAITAFNHQVVSWNAAYTAMQVQLQALSRHPGRTVEPQLNVAMARAAAQGATTIRAMLDAATRELTPVSEGWRPDEREYAEGMQRWAYGVAQLAEQREAIEHQRQQLTQQAFDVAAAEQRQAFWTQVLLGVAAASGGGAVVIAPSSTPPLPVPASTIQPANAR